MPRAVRNFWFDAVVDGRETTLSAGPKGKDGGLRLTLYMREEGLVAKVLHIDGKPTGDGRLLLIVDGGSGDVAETGEFDQCLTFRTKR